MLLPFVVSGVMATTFDGGFGRPCYDMFDSSSVAALSVSGPKGRSAGVFFFCILYLVCGFVCALFQRRVSDKNYT